MWLTCSLGIANVVRARAELGISNAEMGPDASEVVYVDWIRRTLVSPYIDDQVLPQKMPRILWASSQAWRIFTTALSARDATFGVFQHCLASGSPQGPERRALAAGPAEGVDLLHQRLQGYQAGGALDVMDDNPNLPGEQGLRIGHSAAVVAGTNGIKPLRIVGPALRGVFSGGGGTPSVGGPRGPMRFLRP
jgi:hypothetical protein